MPQKIVSADARALLERLASLRRVSIVLPEDRAILNGASPALLGRMAGAGLLHRVGRGRYLVAPFGTRSPLEAAPIEIIASVALGARPHFFSYLTALIAHGLTDIHSLDLYAAVPQSATKCPSGEISGGHRLQVVRLSDRYWPALERGSDDVEHVRAIPRSKEFYWQASRERALLDGLNRPEISGGLEVVAMAWGRAFAGGADASRICRIANRLGGSSSRRAMLMLDLVGASDAVNTLRSGVNTRSGTVLLGEHVTPDIPRDARSGVRPSVPVETIRGWVAAGLEE